MLGVLLSFLSRGRGAAPVVGEVATLALPFEAAWSSSSVVLMTVASWRMILSSATGFSLVAEGPGTILSSTCMTGSLLMIERARLEFFSCVFVRVRIKGCRVLFFFLG